MQNIVFIAQPIANFGKKKTWKLVANCEKRTEMH